MAVHAIGYVAETDSKAADELWPAYSHTFGRIGRERGWAPMSRAAFNAQMAPTGAFVVGSPETAVTKLRHIDEVLGGVSRVSLMMSGGPIPHAGMLRSIELLGTAVNPALAEASVGV